MNIPIVVVAYNRDHCLRRILSSLSRARYPDTTTLIISIDGGGPQQVKQTAKEFIWAHGTKEIVEHDRNLGLRRHVLSCGSMARQYDGILLLEDDLYVSPWFYRYALKAFEFYRECREISGVSLYSPRYNETAYLPFHPLNDGFDTFFMQLASSWGQVWSREQWVEFEEWYSSSDPKQLIQPDTLPVNTKLWPESSWKKYFIQYMIMKDKYFVYPRHSYTTNFGDKGKNHKDVTRLQVPLVFGEADRYRFAKIQDSNVRYDACCEMDSDCLKRLSNKLDSYEFTVDLYGAKESQYLNKPYVITSKICSDFLQSFDKCLIPIESNIIESISGDKLFLAKTEDVTVERDIQKYAYLKANDINELKYHYSIDELHFYVHKQELIKHILESVSYRVGNKIVLPFSLLKQWAEKKFGKK